MKAKRLNWSFLIDGRRIETFESITDDWGLRYFHSQFLPAQFPGGGRVRADRKFAVLSLVHKKMPDAKTKEIVRAKVKDVIAERLWNHTRVIKLPRVRHGTKTKGRKAKRERLSA